MPARDDSLAARRGCVALAVLALALFAGVAEAQNPTAVLSAPAQIPAGQMFTLDGSRSSDVPPGRIVRYTFTNLTRGTTIATTEPRLQVTEALPPGRHQFQLVVTDDAGNQSDPALIEVIVAARPVRAPARRLDAR